MACQPSALSSATACLDTFAEWTGKIVAQLVLVMMILTCAIVVMRYVFSIGSVYLQESIGYLHALVFMLAMAYTLKHDGHVRVDILYRQFSRSSQAWVNVLGSILFLLPVCMLMLFGSLDYVMSSWRVHEGSPNAGGIPLVYLLKALIPVSAALLALQGVAEVLRGLVVLIAEEKAK